MLLKRIISCNFAYPSQVIMKKKIKMVAKRVSLGIVTVVIILSIFPEMSVRMTMAVSGHPVKAVKENITYDRDGSKTFKTQVYDLDKNSTYTGLSGEKTYMFFVKRVLIFNFAYPGIDRI